MTELEVEILELQKRKLQLEIGQLRKGTATKHVSKKPNFEWLKNMLHNSFEFQGVNSVEDMIWLFERNAESIKGSIHHGSAARERDRLKKVLEDLDLLNWAEEEFARLLEQEEIERNDPNF